MGDFDFAKDKMDDVDPNESFGFKELPAGWHEKVCEVLSVERRQTNAGDGTVVRVTARVCEKQYASNKVWGSYFVSTTNPDKQEGAGYGASAYLKLINGCGFLMPKALKDEKAQKALQIGLVDKFDPETFKDEKLVGQFFVGKIFVETREHEDQPVYPELKGASLIDIDQYEDVVKEAKATKKESKPKTDEPPF